MIDGKDIVKTAFCVGLAKGITDLLYAIVIAFCIYLCFYAPDVTVRLKQFAIVVFWTMTVLLATKLVADIVVEKFVNKLIDDQRNKPNGGLNP